MAGPAGDPPSSPGNGGKGSSKIFGDLFGGSVGGRPSPADLFNGTNGGSKKTPSAGSPSAPKPPPEEAKIVADTSAFELLSRKLGEDEARRLRRFLVECCHGDENSYLFNQALLTLAQWHMAAAVPIETARVLAQHQHTAQDAARTIAQAAEAKLADFAQDRAEISALVAELKGHIGQLGDITQEGRAQLAGLAGELAAVITPARAHLEAETKLRRQRTWAWALSAGIVVAALGWLATYQLERQAGERWKAEQTAQLARWRAQQVAQWPRWAESQAQARLQQLEPATYRLAQQIERSKRQVKLPEGGTGWEVTLFDEGGILSVDSTFDAQNVRQRYQVHLRDDPERAALSAAASAANAGKERARP